MSQAGGKFQGQALGARFWLQLSGLTGRRDGLCPKTQQAHAVVDVG